MRAIMSTSWEQRFNELFDYGYSEELELAKGRSREENLELAYELVDTHWARHGEQRKAELLAILSLLAGTSTHSLTEEAPKPQERAALNLELFNELYRKTVGGVWGKHEVDSDLYLFKEALLTRPGVSEQKNLILGLTLNQAYSALESVAQLENLDEATRDAVTLNLSRSMESPDA